MEQGIGCKRSSKGLDQLPDAPIVRGSSEREENGGSTSEGRVIVEVEDVIVDSLTSQESSQGVATGNEKDSSSISSQDYERSNDEQDDTGCEVWFRHSGWADKFIGFPIIPPCRIMTQSEIKSEVRGHTITHMYIKKTIPDWLADIAPDLVSLRLNDITDIETQIHRIAELVNLEELYILGNRFISHRLHHAVYKLRQLKVLNMKKCGLTELDDRLAELVNLEKLDIGRNKFTSHTLPLPVYKLRQLKVLDISDCGLTELDDRLAELVNLENLCIRHNIFTSHTLPPPVYKLRQLKVLDISNCGLTELDDSIGDMNYLESVNLSGNKNLLKLHKSLAALRHLDAKDCDNLVEPPYFICQAGKESMKQFYADLEKGSKPLMLATIAVIGRKMAGKTSLVESLRQKKIHRTKRGDNHKYDETTKVFNFVQIELKEGSGKMINVIDFGGDEIYHHAYQLTFRKYCIPIVVVNITQYKDQSQNQGWGRREAARRVVFDWISHLYLACPELARPLLVLTHKDEHSLEGFRELRKELLSTINELKKELLEENNIDKKVVIFSNAQQSEFFSESDIFELGDEFDCTKVLKKLEDSIYERADKSEVSVPIPWYQIMLSIKEDDNESHININELLKDKDRQATKQYRVILDFMKRSGWILWYEYKDELKDVIFHDLSKVTEMITKLLDHSSAENIEDKSVIEPGDKEKLWPTTLQGESSSIPADIAIKLLTTFNLIYGPTTVKLNEKCYTIPYFTRRHHFSPSKRDIKLHDELVFLGLSIPLYAYQQMTISFLNTLDNHNFVVYAYGNGASGVNTTRSIESQLIHEPEQQKVIVRVEGDSTLVEKCWEVFLAISQNLTDTVKAAWPATLIQHYFTCPHCLLVDELNPEKRSYKEFMMQAVPFRADSSCRGIPGVPSPLRQPCKGLQQSEMDELESYIRRAHPDEQQEIIRLMGESADVIDKRTPHPQTAIRQAPTAEKVYEMTNTRGRALVINNGCWGNGKGGEERIGSDKDYKHMRTMLEKFGFCISRLSGDKNWSAKEIVEAVHEETELVYQGTTSVHEGLGMFVLVMMSHGRTGTILGHDGKHANLVDIYKLLSAPNFPAMGGKPKLVILQACSGVRKVEIRNDPAPEPDVGTELVPQHNPQQASQQPSQPAVEIITDESHLTIDDLLVEVRKVKIGNDPAPKPDVGPELVPQHNPQQASQQPSQPAVEIITDESHLTIDDLLVMKPSFEEHTSSRNREKGSIFIRALVTTFYRYAGEKDVSTLADMIQEAVRDEQKKKRKEQVPITIKTFTNGRKLYLSPGVDMRISNHPASFTSEDLPVPENRRASLKWIDDREYIIKQGGRKVKKVVIRFEVVRNHYQP